MRNKPSRKDMMKRGRGPSRYAHYRRLNITMSEPLLKMVDETAAKEFTTRSGLIRNALSWYLRPQGRDLDQTDPEAIFELMKLRKAQAAMRKWNKENPPTEIE